METVNYTIKYKKGTTFRLDFKIRNKETQTYWNFDGYTARLVIKSSSNSTTSLLEATDENYITLSGTQFSLTVPSAFMASLPVGNHVYDLDLSSPTEEDYTPLSGKFVAVWG